MHPVHLQPGAWRRELGLIFSKVHGDRGAQPGSGAQRPAVTRTLALLCRGPRREGADQTPCRSQQAPKGALKDRRPGPGSAAPSSVPPTAPLPGGPEPGTQKGPRLCVEGEVQRGWGAGCAWLAPADPEPTPHTCPPGAKPARGPGCSHSVTGPAGPTAATFPAASAGSSAPVPLSLPLGPAQKVLGVFGSSLPPAAPRTVVSSWHGSWDRTPDTRGPAPPLLEAFLVGQEYSFFSPSLPPSLPPPPRNATGCAEATEPDGPEGVPAV